MNARSSLLLTISVGLSLACGACGAQVLDVGSDGAQQAPAQEDPNKSSTKLPAGTTNPSWFPSSNCTDLGPTVKTLIEPGEFMEVSSLAPNGPELWFDINDMRNQGIVRKPSVVSTVPGTSPASAAPVVTDYRSLAGFFGDKLVYVRTTHVGDGSKTDPRVEEVVLLDRASNTSTVLPNPRGTTYVSGIHVHPSGVYWLSREYDAMVPESISRWNAAAPAELTTIENYSSMVTDGTDLFYVRWERLGGSQIDIRLEAVPVAGGTPRVLRTWPYDGAFHYSVVAVDDADVYFTQQTLVGGGTIDAGDLVALKKDGTTDRVVAAHQKFGPATFRIDPDYVMWTDQDAQQTIVRVKRTGGALERIENQANRWVTSLAVDRCNIYWSVANPAAIYGRSRLP